MHNSYFGIHSDSRSDEDKSSPDFTGADVVGWILWLVWQIWILKRIVGNIMLTIKRFMILSPTRLEEFITLIIAVQLLRLNSGLYANIPTIVKAKWATLN